MLAKPVLNKIGIIAFKKCEFRVVDVPPPVLGEI